MEYVKLQVGCIFVLGFLSVIYVQDAARTNVRPKRSFLALVMLCPLLVFVDGLTAWTVNHLDTIPRSLNLFLHCTFFVLTDITLFVAHIYFYQTTRDVPKVWWKRILMTVPLVASVTVILLYINQLEFIEGVSTNYSMGIPVYSCFVLVVYYFGLNTIYVLMSKRKITNRIFVGELLILGFALAALVMQATLPEALTSSIVPTIMLLGAYLLNENPQYQKLSKHNQEMISGFSALVESRDDNTGGHIMRTRQYVDLILEEMRKEGVYKDTLNREFAQNVSTATPMHDIGKITTPDGILLKPGKLTDEEYTIMKTHAARGSEIIRDSFGGIQEKEFLEVAYNVARYHHERWDGKGYPEGLQGEDIPLCARIVAIADVFDAVSAKRCYRDALPLQQCFKIIQDGRGTAFDPLLVDIFLKVRVQVVEQYLQKGERL